MRAEETLETALAAFADNRSHAIAEVIDVLGRAAVESFVPPRERRNLAFHRAWQAAATDPRARTWCLDQLTTKLPMLSDGKETAYGDKLEALIERLAVLETVPPDPRIAAAMLARFELREPVTNFVDAHTAMVRLVGLHADDATAEAVRDTGLPEELRALELPAPVELSAQDAERWAVARPAPDLDLESLFRTVREAPDDDAARTVIADALQEHGDPRGELIALQLREARGEASIEAIARATALVKEHGKSWLGTLRPIVYRAELRRGFLARLELAGSWASSKWDQHALDPLLATVEEIETGQANEKVFAAMLESPLARPNLRRVEIFSNAVFHAVTVAPLPKLEHVACFRWKRGKANQRFVADVLPLVERIPAITSIGCDLALVTMFSKQLVERLVAFECRDKLPDALALWKKWKHLRRLRCSWPDDLELVRDDDREYARIRPGTFFKDSGEGLSKLPAHIRRLDVIGNKAWFDRASKALGARFEMEFHPPPSGLISGTKA